jgi:hypothetical protein
MPFFGHLTAPLEMQFPKTSGHDIVTDGVHEPIPPRGARLELDVPLKTKYMNMDDGTGNGLVRPLTSNMMNGPWRSGFGPLFSAIKGSLIIAVCQVCDRKGGKQDRSSASRTGLQMYGI